MKIRCLAVDDESYAVDVIATYIQKTPFLSLVSKCTNALEALEIVQNGTIDLVFLDIQMHELSGIDFIKLCEGKVKVILTTAYSQYAVEGFDLNVVDYLLKPVSYERFLKSASKALSIIQLEAIGLDASVEAHMFVKGGAKGEMRKIYHKDILFLEGMKNYISIYMSKERIVTYQRLMDMESLLPANQFCRVHKSYIVALANIHKLDGNNVWIGETMIPVSETYKKQFLEMFNK